MNSIDLFPYHGHRFLAIPGILFGVLFLFLVFKAGNFVTKLALFLIAGAFFVGAYWWSTNIRS